MKVFTRSAYDALLSKESRMIEAMVTKRKNWIESCGVFSDGVWTQARENRMNQLEEEVEELKAAYEKACEQTKKYLQDCGIFSNA